MEPTFLFLQRPGIVPSSHSPDGWEACAEEFASLLKAGPVLRFDLAWRVISPMAIDAQGVHDIPSGNPRTQMNLLHHWLHQTLQSEAGTGHNVVALVPALTPAAEEWLRINVSFYTSTVAMSCQDHHSAASVLAEEWIRFKENQPSAWQNWWLPPLLRPWEDQLMPVLQKAKKRIKGADFTYLTALLGSERLAIQTYHIEPYQKGNRYHSHSDIDGIHSRARRFERGRY